MVPSPPDAFGQERAASYGTVLRLRHVARVGAAMMLSRCAGYAFAVALVLFVLLEYHSAALAGLCSFFSEAPGLIVSPVMGALLDRGERTRLASLDYLVSAATMALIGALSWWHMLSAPLLIGLVAVCSLTSPLSWTGMRSALPLLVPEHMWDHANAVDLAAQEIAAMVGPVAAGVLIVGVGPQWTLVLIAATFACAALALWNVDLPATVRERRHILSEAWQGLVYLGRNATLRGQAISTSVSHLCDGALIIGVPLVVLGRLHGSPLAVGMSWAIYGICSAVSGLFLAHARPALIGVGMYTAGAGGTGVAAVVVAISPTISIVAVGMALFGISASCLNMALLGLRQRRTDPEMLGRVIATSMSLNASGIPIGAALAGALASWSVTGSLLLGAASAALGAVTGVLMIPRNVLRPAGPGDQ